MGNNYPVVVGFLLIIATATLITVLNPQQGVKAEISKTNSKFYYNNSGNWTLAATETSYLTNGSLKLSVVSASLSKFVNNLTGMVYVNRTVYYAGGAVVVSGYEYNGSETDALLFPVREFIIVKNGVGLNLTYKVSGLQKGLALKGLKSSYGIGNVVITWQEPTLSASVTSSGVLSIVYGVVSNPQTFLVRLFDAPAITDNWFRAPQSGIQVGQLLNFSASYSNTGSASACAGINLSITENNIRITSTSNTAVRLTRMNFSGAGCTASSLDIGFVNCTTWPLADDNMMFNWTVIGVVGNGTANIYNTNVTNVAAGCTGTAMAGGTNVTRVNDTSAPNISINSPLMFANISGWFMINASINDSGNNTNFRVNASLTNSANNGLLPMKNYGVMTNLNMWWNVTNNSANVPDGRYNVSVNATDATSNTTISSNVSVTIDNTMANVTAIAPTNGSTVSGVIPINASVNDSLSGVFNVTFRLTTATGSTLTPWLNVTLGTGSSSQGYWNTTFNTTPVPDGTYNITVNATDFAGNQLIINMSQVIIGLAVDNNATLNVTLYTSNWLNGTVNSTITLNASVLASGGAGHQVNGTVFFGQTNGISQIINATQFGFPFYNTTQNFSCGFMISNSRCDLNITINLTTMGAYWNLTFNFTSNNTYILPNGSSTFKLNISDVPALPIDSCTYSGAGDWNVNCADNCRITAAVDLNNNNLILTGAGTLSVEANIYNIKKPASLPFGSNGLCKVNLKSGAKMSWKLQ